eukprot:5979917-Amphidinium_carterae.1
MQKEVNNCKLHKSANEATASIAYATNLRTFLLHCSSWMGQGSVVSFAGVHEGSHDRLSERQRVDIGCPSKL